MREPPLIQKLWPNIKTTGVFQCMKIGCSVRRLDDSGQSHSLRLQTLILRNPLKAVYACQSVWGHLFLLQVWGFANAWGQSMMTNIAVADSYKLWDGESAHSWHSITTRTFEWNFFCVSKFEKVVQWPKPKLQLLKLQSPTTWILNWEWHRV